MRSGHLEKSALHNRLIKSIEELIHDSRDIDAQRLRNIVSALKNASISNNDHKEVLAYSFLLINEIPAILKNPRNHFIRDLANECRLSHEESLKAQYQFGTNPRSK